MSTLTHIEAPAHQTQPADTHTSERSVGRVSWKRGLATGLVAAVVITAVAAAFRASGQALEVTDGPIPVLAFAQMVLLSTVVGIVLARHTSRTTFHRAAIALTVLSCVPDVTLGDGFVSKAGLVLTHVIAAAIVIPRLARR